MMILRILGVFLQMCPFEPTWKTLRRDSYEAEKETK